MANVIYTPNDILEQEFKTKMRGYDPIEVDEFLDNVIKDYEAYNKEILTLKEENDRLKAKVEQLSKAQPTATRVKEAAPKSSAVTNFDILKRLSNLEREVFGKKLDQQSANNAASTDFSQNYTQDESDIEKTRQF
ncbi:cell division regulator GpsB [Enterococcus devriesei]|uniref:Cell cycle protein GpsB n=1 Tax=Enterococcus devriesei TaxID=319970 RepID=A0A1L8SY12_9ENTE|nr:cell division regulator GpsB [Enterococcus devriesei]MBU5364764.1 cell division regulator GpsB [Enterococcus devriesei]MDT2820357.1 cell division regulator GpsB [Enterococcus devriesei]MDU6524783.1 cell division regulator GpsB [Enterococcus sp.]OJG36920.1 DivIVA domain-containing protein [Enterococcus devriesei]